jgi:hypothetical protein
VQPFDPYRPPADQGPPPPQGPSGPDGEPLPWSPGEVLGEAWEIVKVHWAVLIFAPLVVMVLAGLPSGILNQIPVKGVFNIVAVRLMAMVIQVLLGAFFEVGLARVFITAARREIPDIGAIFQGGASFARMLGVQVVMTILSLTLMAVSLGPAVVLAAGEIGLDAIADPTLLLSRLRHLGPNPFIALCIGMLMLVPLSVFLTMRLSFAEYYIADTDRGPFEALGASWTALRGNMLGLCGYLILVFFLTIGGLMMCCVGVFLVLAVTRLGMAIIYTRISGRVGSAARV